MPDKGSDEIIDRRAHESAMVREAIGLAAENVLETMFFVIPNDGSDEDAAGTRGLALRASLNSSGKFSGDFTVETPVEAAREIAANFAGVADPQDITDEKAAEVMAELANMVCGSTLSILHRDQLFDLDAPQVRVCSQMSTTAPADVATARSLDLGNGSRIVFRLRGHA